MTSIITELLCIFLWASLKLREFSLHWRPFGCLRLLSALWSGGCRFDIFTISSLYFNNYVSDLILYSINGIYIFTLQIYNSQSMATRADLIYIHA